MGHRIDTQLVLDALTMALWRLLPEQQVLIHSDQGCQFAGREWLYLLAQNKMLCSTSQRGHSPDNAVAESFFQLLKRERLRRQNYATRDDARSDVFSYIEMFYNPTRRNSKNDGLFPAAFEQRHSHGLKAV
jgi:putative transposase